LKHKLFMVLLLTVSVLTIFPLVSSVVVVLAEPLASSAQETNYLSVVSDFEPCGDPIVTPVYPG
jgi:hypothetical protein